MISATEDTWHWALLEGYVKHKMGVFQISRYYCGQAFVHFGVFMCYRKSVHSISMQRPMPHSCVSWHPFQLIRFYYQSIWTSLLILEACFSMMLKPFGVSVWKYSVHLSSHVTIISSILSNASFLKFCYTEHCISTKIVTVWADIFFCKC